MPIKRPRRDVQIRVQRRDLGAIIANEFGPVRMRTIIRKSNSKGDPKKILEHIDQASIDVSNFRETTWECGISMERDEGFKPLTDWIKIEEEVLVGEEWKTYPRGVYKFLEKGGTINRAQQKWDLQGYSAEIILHSDGPNNVYTVPKDTNILARVRDIIIARGFDAEQCLFPFNNDKILGHGVQFDPNEDDSKGTWLRICNRLLGMGGFHALAVTADGQFITDELRDVRVQKPIVKYGPRSDQEPIVLDGVTELYGMESFCNMVIVTSEDPKQLPPVFAVAKNNDPNSEGSYQQLGRWVKRRIKKEHIVSQFSAQLLADRNLQAGSSFAHQISYSTPPDPERGLKEYHEMYIPVDDDDDIDAVFRNTGWSQEVYPQPLEMQFESSRRMLV